MIVSCHIHGTSAGSRHPTSLFICFECDNSYLCFKSGNFQDNITHTLPITLRRPQYILPNSGYSQLRYNLAGRSLPGKLRNHSPRHARIHHTKNFKKVNPVTGETVYLESNFGGVQRKGDQVGCTGGKTSADEPHTRGGLHVLVSTRHNRVLLV